MAYKAQLINASTASGTRLGDPGRTAFTKLNQNLAVTPWGANTLNVGFFAVNQDTGATLGLTAVQIIQSAINYGVANGFTTAYVPNKAPDGTVLLPFAAGSVTFNTSLKMTREGSNPTYWDVKAYGAAGDGATDDWAACQAAVAGALVRGGTVFFPDSANPYLVSTNIADTGGPANVDLIIRGASWNSIIKTSNQTFSPIFMVNIGSLQVENLTIDGNWTSGVGNQCVRSDVNDTRIRNCRLKNAGQNGVFWNPVAAGQVTRLTVSGCHFISCGLGTAGGWGIAVQSGKNISIVNNIADSCGAGLVDLEPTTIGASIGNAAIVGNVVVNSGSTIANTGSIQAFGMNVAAYPSVTDITITGNTILGSALTGIQLADVQRATVSGNTISSCNRNGIWCRGNTAAQFVNITGNTIYDAGGAAANTYDAIVCTLLRDGSITDNLCVDDASKTRYFINIDNSCQRVVRRNNHFPRSAQTANYIDSATILDQGTAVLVGGTVTVTTSQVRTGDVVYVTRTVTGGTLGHLSVGTITDATSFVINSSSGTDTSTVAWEIAH